MSRKIDEMTKEEQYRAYLNAHSDQESLKREREAEVRNRDRELKRMAYERVRKRKADEAAYRAVRRNSADDIPDTASRNYRRKRRIKPKSKGRGIRRTFRILFLTLAALAVTFTAIFFNITKSFDRHDIGDKNFGIYSGVAASLKEYRNILILGSDARKDEGYDGSRTDAIVILSIHKKSGKVRMISIMRDSYLEMRGYDKESLVFSKATHANAYDGAMNTVSMLNRNLDLNIKEYVLFNWEVVSDLIDEMGGIEIDVKADELNDLNEFGNETAVNVGGSYEPLDSAGVHTLSGTQAVTYCRIRKTSGGDVGRGRRYKAVIEAVMKKGIKHPLKMKKSSKKIFPYIRTNMGQFGMFTAAIGAPRFKFEKSLSWPKEYYGGILRDGVWYAVPQTLESNVEWLHAGAFGDTGYVPSTICRNISDRMAKKSGVM